MNGLLVAGTASEAGKSAVTAGICRWLARRGVKVAPFKAQNMSLNSVVTRDGAEIGRAQAMQAAAAGIEPEAALNPVLLKPGSRGTSQVMVLGRPVAEADALSYPALKPRLAETVLACLAGLADRFDAVICEGAGSPAEINLREHDIANMGLARAAGLPVIVVADIDRGGALAALYGTLALLSREDQALVAGFVVNKFRGDVRLLEPGLDRLRDLTGRPVLGVLPWAPGLWVDAEDSLSLGTGPDEESQGHAGEILRVAVIRLPRISNFTDTDPLAAEPGVAVRFVTSPAEVSDADLVILPGSRATVAPGLGLLPATAAFGPAKVLRLRQETCDGEQVTGYEIHHGVVTADGGEPFPGGCAAGAVLGTTWHGIFESDGFRRALLRQVAAAAGRSFGPGRITFAQIRERKLDTLADLVADHMDTAALLDLIDHGAPAGLPFIPPGAP
jgi:adenosylcobyric acid synthase